ncbi:unnamed protein product [Linum trigynum]|uniref:Calmodulin-binding protein n=1 Tax=Linum trigynum TaxID=586398 RepID=A0AAV2GCP3_9ROSI
MMPKRRFDAQWEDEHNVENGGRSSSIPSPKRFRNAVRDVLGKQSMADFASSMEPFLRSVIREEVEKTVVRVLSHRSSLGSRTTFEGSGVKKGLVLHFVNKLPSRIFTNARIEAEDGNPMRIVLLDAATNTIVSSGPLSSMKIEITVLNGDFGCDDGEDWCAKDFNDNVIKEREGRRPLVTGELSIVLKDGVGQISDVVFTDNSSWQRSRRFRLGAKAVQRGGASGEVVRIREARSEPFVVKDHRGELYKKHYPPKLGDEVWRLERIAKEGAFHKRLSANGISTVKEFLKAYVIDQTTLRSILGGGISNRIWDSIVQHANTCVLDETKFYVYNDHAQGLRLLFNSVYKLVGAMFDDGQSYEPLDRLTPPQKVLVENSKKQAYRNLEGLIPMDSRSAIGPSRQLPLPPPQIQSDPFHISNNLTLHQLEFPVLRHDESDLHLDFNNNNNYSTSSSSYDSISTSPIQLSPFLRTASFKFSGGGSAGHFAIPQESGGWVLQSGGSSSWPATAPEDTALVPAAASPAPWGPLFFSPGITEEEVAAAVLSSFPSFGASRMDFHTAVGRPRARWCKIRTAFKVRSMLLAARRMWHSRFYE